MENPIDSLWVVIAAALVLLMQAGFMLLEGGLARSKNSINVAQKNLGDFAVSVVAYALIGFPLMFGASLAGLIGWPDRMMFGLSGDAGTVLFFVFQAMFAGTCATIVSGTVAERFSFTAYLVCIPITAGLFYPVFGHWVWGGGLSGDAAPWLASMGFLDFAGSTVVHAAGGWISLAAALVVGPRLGRFAKDGTPIDMQSHNLVLSGLGVMLLFVGWLGFNGGSMLAFNAGTVSVIGNTLLAGVFGGVTGMVFGHFTDGLFRPQRLFNGILGGLVAITAGCAFVGPVGAIVLGCGGALVALYGENLLLKLRIDDVVGAIPVHAFAGLFGTLAFPLFGVDGAFGDRSILSQIGVQAVGSAVAFIWFFGCGYVMFRVIDLVIPVRVPEEAELRGLNASEHGSEMGFAVLERRLMDILAGNTEDTELRLDPGDDAYDLSVLFDKLLRRLRIEKEGRVFAKEHERTRKEGLRRQKMLLEQRADAERQAENIMASEISNIIAQVRNKDMSSRVRLTHETRMLSGLATGVNEMIDLLTDLIGRIDDDFNAVSVAANAQKAHAENLVDNHAGRSEAISEVSTRLSEVDEAITQGREASARAREAVNGAQTASENGLTSIAGAVDSAERMRQASADALALINSIDEISEQTNLLAINAGIEAARAGTEGLGFAIVATEVRELAAKSAELSEQVANVLKTGSNTVEECVTRINDSSEAFRIVVHSAAFTRDAVEDIFETAQRQSELNGMLGQSISVIEKYGRSDGKHVQDTAVATDDLIEKVGRLRDAVSAYNEEEKPLFRRSG